MSDEARDAVGDYHAGWHDPENATIRFDFGLSEEVVREISRIKGEPAWMTEARVKAYHHFVERPMPTWGNTEMLESIDFDAICYYLRSSDATEKEWEDVPEDIRNTFDRLGIPEAEQKWLSGVTAQYESEAVYHSIREDLEEQGVIFLDMDSGLREHEEIVKQYFCSVVPHSDNKFAALNTAVWSGGSFIYVPSGVHVEMPVQAYFRINAKNMGQFERTLIIADEGSSIHYVEGCTAPTYSTDSLHSAVVELIAMPGAHIRYSTVQNWSNNVYNLVTKRGIAHENAKIEWIDGNLGCLEEGSTVTTPDGVRPIETIEIGDEVLSWDQEKERFCYRPVTAKRFSGWQQVHEVSHGERRLNVTGNHPFLSWTHDPDRARKLGRYDISYIRADRITHALVPHATLPFGGSHGLTLPPEATVTEFATSNQYQSGLLVQRERIRQHDLPHRTDDDLMWLFGLFTGDGSIEWSFTDDGAPRYAKVVFSVPTGKRGHDRMLQVMSTLTPKPPRVRADGISSTWNGIDLAQYLELNGWVSGAMEKRIPSWVGSIPETQRCSLIAGYVDSDGCASAKARRLQIKSVNRRLLEDVARILVDLGIDARINLSSPGGPVRILDRDSVARPAWVLTFLPDPRILRHCSAEIQESVSSWPERTNVPYRTIGRSSIVIPDGIGNHSVQVSEISPDHVPTWDIEVDGTANFVSQGFIVHNSRLTMKYPAVILKGEGSHAEVISVAYAGEDQHQDAGAKVHHLASRTTSRILSKSISKDGGRGSYRGMVQVSPKADDCKVNVVCDALILDDESQSDTYPTMEIANDTCRSEHEASVSKVSDDQVFYLMSRGHSEEEALAMIVNGFFEPFTRELPMEYAVELNRLMALEMEGSIG